MTICERLSAQLGRELGFRYSFAIECLLPAARSLPRAGSRPEMVQPDDVIDALRPHHDQGTVLVDPAGPKRGREGKGGDYARLAGRRVEDPHDAAIGPIREDRAD